MRAPRLRAAVVVMVMLTLTGCVTRQAGSSVPTLRGGTLHVLLDSRVDALDPQRIGSSGWAAFAVRTYLRTLTAQAPAGVGFSPALVGDLATTTGRVTDGGRTWSFSLVSNATWQDGRFVTCAQVKYGVSRSFGRDGTAVSSASGAQQAVDLLDIAATTDAQGRRVSAYRGPYSRVGQDLYDQAVTCTDQTLTFHLNVPRPDFDEVVSLPAFAPVRPDQDTEAASPLSLFASGPYMLEGNWKPGQGGRFVRNRKWLPAADPIRLAWPDVVEVEEARPTTEIAQRLLDDATDTDRAAVTWSDVPPAVLPALLAPAVATRATRPPSGAVDVLLPTTGTGPLADATTRRAFAVATDRSAYASADGRPMVTSTSSLGTDIPGRPASPPAGITNTGDPTAAAALLAGAGVTRPVTLRLGYASSEAAMRALTALQPDWAAAGFAVTLVADPGGQPVDVTLTSVVPQWPTADAVLPALARRTGDPALTGAVDAAYETSETAARAAAWSDLDTRLTRAGDVVPLAERLHVHLHGSEVRTYLENPLLGGDPDLATVSVR